MTRLHLKAMLALSACLLSAPMLSIFAFSWCGTAAAQTLDPRLSNNEADQVFQALTTQTYIKRINNARMTSQAPVINALRAQVQRNREQIDELSRSLSLSRQQIDQLYQALAVQEAKVADQERDFITGVSKLSEELEHTVESLEKVAASTKDDPGFQAARSLLQIGNTSDGLKALDEWKTTGDAPLGKDLAGSKKLTNAIEETLSVRQRAYAFARLGLVGISESITDFKILTQMPSATFEDWVTLHELYEQNGKPAQNAEAMREALKLAPSEYLRISFAGELAHALLADGKTDEALTTITAALGEAEKFESPTKELTQAHLLLFKANIDAWLRNGQAVEDKRRAVELYRILITRYSRTDLSNNYLVALDSFIDACNLNDPAQLAEAKKALQQSDTIIEGMRATASLPRGTDADSQQIDFGFHYTETGKILMYKGDYSGAENALIKSLEIFGSLHKKDPAVGRYTLNIEFANTLLAYVYYHAYSQGNVQLSKCYGVNCSFFAEQAIETAVSSGEQLVDQQTENNGNLDQLFLTYSSCVDIYWMMNEWDKAKAHYKNMKARYDRAHRNDTTTRTMDESMAKAKKTIASRDDTSEQDQ